MVSSADLRSGKGHKDENFPVASHLIHPRHRGIILAFYNFVRVADDIADHASLSEGEKLARLDRLEAALLGSTDEEEVGIILRKDLGERGLSPEHAQDVLTAFRLDATKRRYENWDDLIEYCRYSAMPVGRFVLDVHWESRDTWTASDALCAALQIINHIQDCGKDYRSLDRIYLPLDLLAANQVQVQDLGADASSPGLRGVLTELAARTRHLLTQSRPLARQVRDSRLALEIAVIQALAERLTAILNVRDPLKDRVHLSKYGVAGTAFLAVTRTLAARPFMRHASSRETRPT